MNIPLAKPEINKKEIDAINKSIKSGWLAHGKYNAIFEKNFAKFIGTKYAVAVNSCTSALELALWANNISSGEVIIPSFTWVSTANVVVLSGCKPIFCDVDLKTRNISVENIRSLINKKTKAIIAVHFAGLPCDLIKLKNICKKKKILLIEDSAECIGGKQNNIIAGSVGVGCFSFYPTKNITTCEGGMITSNSLKFIKKAKALSAHGIPNSAYERTKKKNAWYRNARYAGRNFRMPDPLAAMGIVQLSKLNKMNAKRNKIAKIYNSRFIKNADIKIQITPKKFFHSYQMYSIYIYGINKEEFIKFLNSKKIGASSHFDPPVHKQDAYKKFSKKKLKNTELLSKYSISLPIFSEMTPKQTNMISEKVIKNYKAYLVKDR